LTNHGAGYTTPPLLTLQYYPLGGVKNNFENKAGNRVLYYGNIGSNTWNNSMQAQQGSWLLLSPLSNMADGYPMSYIHNITVADNWMDRNFNAVIIGFNNGCSGIFAAKGVQPWSMANVYGCMPPWDPWGVITAPTWAVPGGYSSSGLAGGGAPYNVYVVNNLVTGRDIVTDDEAMIPSEAIWSGRGGSYRFQTPLVLQMGAGVTYLHNTLEKRPSYGIANSVGPYNNQSNLLSFGWWAGTPSGTAGSILFNTYFWSNVMQCIPYADTIGSGSAATNWVQTVIGCPTKGSGTDAGKCVATEAGGGQDSEKHFWGNVMYDDRTATVGCQASTLAGFDATWNFNGRTNNYRDATYTSSTQPNKYANISLYLPGQRPGDWTLNDTAATTALNGGSAGLPPNAATPGIDNAALMAAIGQTTPADIPMVITGNWSGAVIPTFFSISGTVTGASASVSMTLQPGNMTTTASPNYTFASVPENGIYTITPVLTNCTFTPPSITTAALTGNLTGQNFSASCVTPPIPTPPAALHTGKIGPP
jgi:hypothetical protein